jgi:hypothetical protein
VNSWRAKSSPAFHRDFAELAEKKALRDDTFEARTWLKTKCLNREEFVVVGWSDPEGRWPRIGALLLGYYTPDGKLVYAVRAGTGMPDAEFERLWQRQASHRGTPTPIVTKHRNNYPLAGIRPGRKEEAINEAADGFRSARPTATNALVGSRPVSSVIGMPPSIPLKLQLSDPSRTVGASSRWTEMGARKSRSECEAE